jgi:hypothetical protein
MPFPQPSSQLRIVLWFTAIAAIFGAVIQK